MSFAGETVWNFAHPSHTSGGNNNGNTYSYVIGSGSSQQRLTVSGWSSTGSKFNNRSCGTVHGVRGDDVDSCVESARLNQNGYGSNYAGIGVQNRDENNNTPNHAIDNSNYNSHNRDLDFDMVLLTFDKAVNITSFDTGWEWGKTNSRDSDSSVFALKEGAHFSSFQGRNWSQILNNGWQIASENTERSGTSNGGLETFRASNGNIHSRYWLVGAYNSLFSHKNWSDNNDAFKLYGLRTTMKDDPHGPGPGPVNAPGTLFLFGSLLTFMYFRRKR